jgi:hypothetical protein
MSQINQKFKTSSMTLREYYIKIKEPYFSNEWGWFVDTELISRPTRVINRQSVLQPIKEYPSIRSMKSIQNLHDLEENNIYNNKKQNYYSFTNLIYTNLIGMITFAIVCFIIY